MINNHKKYPKNQKLLKKRVNSIKNLSSIDSNNENVHHMIHKMKRVSSNLVLLNRKLSDTKLSTLENICAVTPPKNKLHQHQLSYQNC